MAERPTLEADEHPPSALPWRGEHPPAGRPPPGSPRRSRTRTPAAPEHAEPEPSAEAANRSGEVAPCPRDAILEAIAVGASAFLLQTDWRRAIGGVLEQLGRATDVSRVYLFERELGPEASSLVTQRHEWAAPGVRPQIDNPSLQRFSLRDNGLGPWEQILSTGGVVHGHTRELGEKERRTLEAQDIKSIVLVPIAVDGDWWGFVGFDECAREREWSQPEIDALRAFGDILGGAISRQRLEAKLHEAEAKFRNLVEQIPAVAYLAAYGPQGDWLYISPQIEHLLGYSAGEWLAHPHPMTSFTHPDDISIVREAEERLLGTGEIYRAEIRIRAKDGRWVWIVDEARPVRDPAGQVLFMQGVMYDVTGRREDEEARVQFESSRQTERKLQRAMDEVHLACLSRDLEGRVLYCNRFLLGLTGWRVEEVIGSDWWELCAPDVPSEERARFLQDVRSGVLLPKREATLTARTGESIEIVWSETVVRDASGAVVGVLSFGQDVTQQRRAEIEVRASERRFRALTDNAHDAITLVGEDATIAYASPSTKRILGYPSEDVLGTNALGFVHPEDLPHIADLFSKVVAEPLASAVAQFRMRRPDGSWMWVETFAENRLEDVDVRAVVLNTRDISERKGAEEQLQEAEQRYRTLVEQVPAIVYVDRIDGGDVSSWPTVFISPQVERILGYTPEEWIGDPEMWQRIVHPDDRELALAADLAVISGAEPARFDYRVVAKDGRVVWLRDESAILRDEDGTPRYQEGLLMDVTELKAQEQALAEAEARYRSLLENLPIGFYIEPADDRIGSTTFASPQMETLTGFPSERWTRDPDLSLRIIHPDDLDRIMAAERHSTETGDPFREEYRIVRADGTVAWVQDVGILVHGDDGTPLRWEGFMLDVTQRRRAEEELREAEAKYRSLVERLPAIVYVDPVGMDEPSLYVSPKVEEILGYPPERFTADADAWYEITHPDDLEQEIAQEWEAFETGAGYRHEYRLLARDGREVWVDDRTEPIRDEEGRIVFWHGVTLDVTERKRAEERLREAEFLFRSVVENAPAAFFIEPADGSLCTSYMGPQIEAITGYPPEEWMTDDPGFWPGIIHPDDRERVLAEDDRVSRTGDPFSMEFRLVKPDGTIVWILDEAVPVRDESGEITSWHGFIHDITRKVETDRLLRETEVKYQALVEGIPGVVYVDSNDPISATEYLSPQIEQMTGYRPEELIGEPGLWEKVVHPDDVDELWRDELAFHERRETYVGEYRLVARDGSVVWVSDLAIPLFDQNGDLTRWIGIILDITRLKETERELARALKAEREITMRLRELDGMKDAFLTAVSHELRTPLTVILGSAITLDTSGEGLAAPDRRTLATSIVSGARKLQGLVQNLLDTDRLARGVLVPRRTPTDLTAMIERVVDDTTIRSDRSITVDADRVRANVDAAMVERILENLLVNAEKHTPPGSRIWVCARRHDEGTLVIVEDDGPGVQERSRDEIFEPFYRGPDVPSHAPGIGVGLSLVAHFARLHAGRAWVEDRPGGGASFRVYLPDSGDAAEEG